MEKPDNALIQNILEGDQQAFEELIRRYQGFVHNVVYHYFAKREDVEDIAQEVFFKVYQALRSYDADRPFKHWLGRITSNMCIDEFRKRKRSRLISLESDLGKDERASLDQMYQAAETNSFLSAGGAEASLDLLKKAMDTLSEKDRITYVLREVEGLEYDEIGSMLGTSGVAARIRVSRSRQQLKKKLEVMLNV
jgi:RNA polymerase sigma-70 factor (ECF subfamily)